jgi:hypothetical protein
MYSSFRRQLLGDGPWSAHLLRALRVTYTATTFLSALLLFAVQPMLAKMVLPKLGGSPSVWAVSMCFFQGALLLGYLYAFVLNRQANPRRALVVHLVVMAVACLVLPVRLPDSGVTLIFGGSYLWLVVVLGMAVGLPFLAIAANSPLLQAWFAHTGHRDAHEPYFLYRASNAGSLAALLAYPVLFEPTLTLPAQAAAWSIGFVLLALMIALCGTLMVASVQPTASAHQPPSQSDDAGAESVDWRQRLAWMGLAFVPSGLLVAFTTFLTTDVASAPFLWIAPLAIYLGTYILVFRPWRSPSQRWLEAAQPIVVAIALLQQSDVTPLNLPVDAAVGLAAFVTTALVCHRRLYQRRPAAARLTEFYLWMSFGGVLGGVFAAIVAPQLFSGPIEYPLLLALGLAWRLPLLKGWMPRWEWATTLAGAAAAIALVAGLATGSLGDIGRLEASTRQWLPAVVGAVVLATLPLPRLQLVAVALVTVVVTALPGQGYVHAARSFFGVHRVVDTGPYRLLSHGTTLHGAQRLVDASGFSIALTVPPPAITYFYPGSSHVVGLELMRRALNGDERAAAVGIIGLGAGAMACHARPGEKWTFFEIDPLVIDIAKDPRLFTYMSLCGKDAGIVMGDARITLSQQKNGAFDYLLFDAFTSDAVPAHLLTVEAIRLYFEKLSDRGVLGLHISNKHLDLVKVVAANVQAIPGLSALYIGHPGKGGNLDMLATRFVLVARRPEILEPVANSPYAQPLVAMGASPWTDDFSNVASALIRNYRDRLRDTNDVDIEYATAAIARYPDDILGYKLRAAANLGKGDYAAAIDDATTMIQLFPSVGVAYKVRGLARQLSGDDHGAIADLTAHLSQHPSDLLALEKRGISYDNIGNREAALGDYRRVLSLSPVNGISRELLARLGIAR